ncbi:hypothetical protein Q7C_809 [Methylophaga frappieri]|uniref:Uncharacterized protein n=1 Tax=Methylophaga frappieri (strain ATCC BAA-2434 / DSM 25690 / JAM7) TaxID=754477 RepID=I1YGD5_METFJ|nr:hypothetical protein Q7C_809 [Methylophaga frappieri]
MKFLGQGIAFASLVMAATILEINDRETTLLWVLIVFWAISTEWYPKEKRNCNNAKG